MSYFTDSEQTKPETLFSTKCDIQNAQTPNVEMNRVMFFMGKVIQITYTHFELEYNQSQN